MANGRRALAGLQLIAGTDGEAEVGILADKLVVYKPDGTGTPVQVLVLGTVSGLSALGFNGSLIVDGSIVGRSLAAKTITAASGVLDDAVIMNANIGTAQITDLHIVDGSITVSAFASDNGFVRYFSVGSFGSGSADDTFSTVSFATKSSDEITVEAFCYFTSLAFGEIAAVSTLRPHLQVDGVDVTSGVSASWSTYANTGHVGLLMKAKILGNGATRTAALKIAIAWTGTYNYSVSQYRISNCVLSAFIRRR